MNWNIHHSPVTQSTNIDARQGAHGDVFTADMQTAGRGRLDHKWHSRAGRNLLFSAVLDIAGLEPGHISTFPLVVGLAVAETLSKKVKGVMLKWPNDIWVDGRKICGILCERFNDNVIAGVGVNVKETSFPDDIALRTTSLALEGADEDFLVPQNVLREILGELSRLYLLWKKDGFSAMHKKLGKYDVLKGKSISVLASDDDEKPLSGLCDGIDEDGTLIVDGVKVWAGEAHILF